MHYVHTLWPHPTSCGDQSFPDKLLGVKFSRGESIPGDEECGGKTTRFVADKQILRMLFAICTIDKS